MREILAHTLAAIQRRSGGGVDLGGVGGVGELGVDAVHQLARGVQQRPAGREGGPRVVDEHVARVHVHRGKDEFRGRLVGRLGAVHVGVARGFPGDAALHRRGHRCVDQRAGAHVQHGVRAVDLEHGAHVAVGIALRGDEHRIGVHLQREIQHPLPRRVHRLQVQQVQRRLHRRLVVVARVVGDAQPQDRLPWRSARALAAATARRWHGASTSSARTAKLPTRRAANSRTPQRPRSRPCARTPWLGSPRPLASSPPRGEGAKRLRGEPITPPRSAWPRPYG